MHGYKTSQQRLETMKNIFRLNVTIDEKKKNVKRSDVTGNRFEWLLGENNVI